MRNLSLTILLLSLLAGMSPAASAQDRFFLRAGAGSSFPFLKNLNDELALQGNSKVDPGYSFAISLGHSLGDMQWSLEAHFSMSYYPEFTYKNDTADFAGKLRHYDYLAVVRRYLRPEGKAFKPSLGAGIGYGVTNLVTGGGKLAAPEAVVSGRIDSAIRENVDISLEGSYYTGLQTKKYEKPFLENYSTDVIKNSAGNPLEDKFGSFDIRIGITVWLKQGTSQ